MKKIKKLAAALAVTTASMLPGWASADTRYDFSFETDNSITASGFFTLDDAWLANGTYQAVKEFSGSLIPNSQSSIISGGSFTGLTVKSVGTLLFRFVSGGITYTANFGGGTTTETGYELSYKPSGATITITEIYNPYSTPSRPAPVTSVSNNAQVPEIDGNKLAQGGLLIAFLFSLFRCRKHLTVASSRFA